MPQLKYVLGIGQSAVNPRGLIDSFQRCASKGGSGRAQFVDDDDEADYSPAMVAR